MEEPHSGGSHDEEAFFKVIDAVMKTMLEGVEEFHLCSNCLFRSVITSTIGTMANAEDMDEDELREFTEQVIVLVRDGVLQVRTLKRRPQ